MSPTLTKKSSESGTVSAFVLNRLHDWGVDRIWGYPGDGINGLIGAFHEGATRWSSRSAATRSWLPSRPPRRPS